jgi:mannose-6-phosphate isomerase-like protein (cupin superfamily)
MSGRPDVVSPDHRVAPPAIQSPRIQREQAFAADDRWVGFVRTQPGSWSGWHHHGDRDTYFYILNGKLEFEYGTGGDTVLVSPGDFARMPPNVVHRERTPGSEGAEIVLVQLGSGPMVVNVDGPEG